MNYRDMNHRDMNQHEKNQHMHHVVVIGAGYAGLGAAYRLAADRRVRVTLVNATDRFVERIRLHQSAAGQTLRVRDLRMLVRGTRINFVQGKVTELQPDQNRIRVGDADLIGYDTLVVALGSVPESHKIPGVAEYAHVVGAGSIDGLNAAVAQLPKGGRVVVVGGGYTAIEVVTEIAESHPHLSVQLVTNGIVGAMASERARTYIRRTFAKMGITSSEHTTVHRIEAGHVVTDSGTIAYDVIIWAGGFRVLPLARQAGIMTNEQGQILVDATLRSVSHPNIYAAGDSAAVQGRDLAMACATAIPMGLHTASSIRARLGGKLPKPFNFGYYWQCIGLGRRDGVIQFVDGDYQPVDSMFTGRFAAWFKETICRFAFRQVRIERYLPGIVPIPPYRKPNRQQHPQEHHEDLVRAGRTL
jgi:NADH:ubiquinone reductase (H+-translocating)